MGMSLSSNGPPATCGQVLSFPLHQGRHSTAHDRHSEASTDGSNESVNGNEGVGWNEGEGNGYDKGRNIRHFHGRQKFEKYPNNFYYVLGFSSGRERVKQFCTEFMGF